jgi:hypothetical protein
MKFKVAQQGAVTVISLQGNVMGGPDAVGDLRRRYGGDVYGEAKTTLERPAPGRACPL